MTKKLEAKTKYLGYLNSPEWKELRAKAYERASDMCELCGHSAGAVHHIEYPKNLDEDELSNLLVVCELCHNKLHGKRIGHYRKKENTSFGDSIYQLCVRDSDGSNEIALYVNSVDEATKIMKTLSDAANECLCFELWVI